MKTNIIAFTGIGLLGLFALAFTSVFEIRLASAQIDATSSSGPPIRTCHSPSPGALYHINAPPDAGMKLAWL